MDQKAEKGTHLAKPKRGGKATKSPNIQAATAMVEDLGIVMILV